MLRTILLASLPAAGGGVARASDDGRRLLGGGDDQRFAFDATSGQAPAGPIGEVVGGGGNSAPLYRPAPVPRLASTQRVHPGG